MRVSRAVVEELVTTYREKLRGKYTESLLRTARSHFGTDPYCLSVKELLALLEYTTPGYSDDEDEIESLEEAMSRWGDPEEKEPECFMPGQNHFDYE